MNMTQLEIALGLIGTFEAALVEDDVWENRPLGGDVVGRSRFFVDALRI